MDLIKERLESLRGGFTDLALSVTAVTGLTSNLFAFVRDHPSSIGIGFWIRTIVVLAVFATYFFRRSLSPFLKAWLITVFLSILYFTSITGLGFFSPMKVLVVFGAITLTFIMNRQWSLIWVVVSSTAYLLSALRLTLGLTDYRLEPEGLMRNLSHWLVEVSLMVMCALAIIHIIWRFRSIITVATAEFDDQNIRLEKTRDEISLYNSDQERLISKDTLEMARMVEENAVRNRDMKSVNAELRQQQQAIIDATANLKVAREKLILSDRLTSLGLLTAGVCHEIRNPLNHIQSSVILLENHFRKSGLAKDNERFFSILKDGVGRMKTIVDSLNQFDHVTHSSDDFIDMVTVVNNCRSILNHLFVPGISFHFRTPHESVRVNVSSDLLHQVILNILQNALEALNETGEVSVDFIVSGEKVIVEIADNGPGIDQAILPSVAEPFFSTKPADKHTGLGLFHAQKLMAEIGGKLIIQSDQEAGTVVRLVFVTTPICS